VVLFDRNAASFLSPFIATDLHLSFTQVGLLSSGLALTWAIAGMLGGVVSDRTGARKVPLTICIVGFSVCSLLSGLAASFAMLLAARLLMGIAEGPILPICQALVSQQSTDENRGHNMGVTHTAGSALLGSFLAPIVLVPIAQAFSWHGAMYLAAAPGLLMAALVWKVVREPAVAVRDAASSRGEPTGFLQVFAFRNILLSIVVSVCIVAFVIIGWVFMPQYYTEVLGFSPGTMSRMMSLLGLSNAIYAFIVPRLSDHIGRKPVIIATCFIGFIIPVLTAVLARFCSAAGAVDLHRRLRRRRNVVVHGHRTFRDRAGAPGGDRSRSGHWRCGDHGWCIQSDPGRDGSRSLRAAGAHVDHRSVPGGGHHRCCCNEGDRAESRGKENGPGHTRGVRQERLSNRAFAA
jgi:MFS family permease